jgi:hypothetical protein
MLTVSQQHAECGGARCGGAKQFDTEFLKQYRKKI